MTTLNTTQLASTPWFKAWATDQTTTTAQVDDIVATLPTDGRILPTRSPNGVRFRGIELLPFQLSADPTINVNLYGLIITAITTLYVVKGAGHGLRDSEESSEQLFEIVADFFKKHF